MKIKLLTKKLLTPLVAILALGGTTLALNRQSKMVWNGSQGYALNAYLNQILHNTRSSILEPGQSTLIEYAQHKYQVTNTSDSDLALNTLDYGTIAWLSGDLQILYPQGINQISIVNDSLYKIAAIFVLNKIRSAPRSIEVGQSISKIVDIESAKAKTNNTGQIIISFLQENNGKNYTVQFPRFDRALYANQNTDYWANIKLCAATIKKYTDGIFTVTRL